MQYINQIVFNPQRMDILFDTSGKCSEFTIKLEIMTGSDFVKKTTLLLPHVIVHKTLHEMRESADENAKLGANILVCFFLKQGFLFS